MPPGSGAARSPALSAEGDTVLFHRTLRRVRTEGNAGHGTEEGGTADPLRAAKARCPAAALGPEADAHAGTIHRRHRSCPTNRPYVDESSADDPDTRRRQVKAPRPFLSKLAVSRLRTSASGIGAGHPGGERCTRLTRKVMEV